MPKVPAAKKLLILGAGVGGLSVIKEIAGFGSAAAILDKIDITIVDEDFSHFLGFTLPWVMRGWRAPDSVRAEPGQPGHRPSQCDRPAAATGHPR